MFTEFTKLKSNFYLHDVETKEQQMFYGDDGKGIGYYHTDFPRKFDLMQLLVPPALQKNFSITLMRINVLVPPHTDSGIKSTINIYLETGDCTTHFYRFATDNPNIKVFVEAVNIEQFTDENLKVCTVSIISEYLKQIIKGEKQFHVTEPIEHSQDENSEAPSIEDEDYYRD